ncbi:uncharacterized protein LOC111360197 [Spodoptera litura]|uniref:Uncharacterized protein LOC111360197 n=1 Tax=Spodoptera litura TaxID=69820 RepID=A0A9J7IYM4_SPOLT|nr:uncharacterized protein LOC111360197 [Spodoptera litura]
MRSKNKYPMRLGETVNSMQVEVIGIKKRPIAKSKKRKGRKRAKKSSVKPTDAEVVKESIHRDIPWPVKKKTSPPPEVRISNPPPLPSPGSPKRLRSGLVGMKSVIERPDTPFPLPSYPTAPLDLRQEPAWEPSYHMPSTTYREHPSPFLKPQEVPPVRRSGVRMRIDGVVVVNPPSSSMQQPEPYSPRSLQYRHVRDRPSVSSAMDAYYNPHVTEFGIPESSFHPMPIRPRTSPPVYAEPYTARPAYYEPLPPPPPPPYFQPIKSEAVSTISNYEMRVTRARYIRDRIEVGRPTAVETPPHIITNTMQPINSVAMAQHTIVKEQIHVESVMEPRQSPPVEPYFRVPQVSALSVTQLPAPSFTQIKPSTVAFLDINSNGTASNCASPSTCSPSHHQLKDERPCVQNYGSEEESDEADDDAPASGNRTPKHLYGISADSPTMDEFSIVYDWVPPSPITQQPTPEPTPGPVLRGPARRRRETARRVKQFLPNDLFQFNWKPLPQSSSSNARREAFSQINIGPTTTYDSTYDSFVAIWDREFMESIAAETNRYAEQMMRRMADEGTLSLGSRILFWKETNADELYVFFAIILAMGIVVKAQMEEYWSTAKDIFSTPSFSTTMAYSRFLLLNRCLHFMDNETCDPINMTPPQAKLLKVQLLVDHLNKRFSELYTLQQNIVIDNLMSQTKRNPYMKEKDHNIVSGEAYEVCECQTGYLWRFDVRTEYDTCSLEAQRATGGLIPTAILKLLDGLENKGYTVWMDKNSPSLARILKSKGFDCVGKLKIGDQYVPGEIAALQRSGVGFGQISGYTSGDVDLIVIGDQKRIAMVSTYHGTGTVIDRNNDKVKSSILYDYNICMGGIDKKDQIEASCPDEKRSQIWYKKIFKRLLNLSVLNAFIMYKHTHEKETQRGFRVSLINSLLKQHQQWNAVIPTPVVFSSDEFVHYAVENRFLPSAKQRMRRHCAHCSKRCTSSCFGCKVPLCVFTCFHPFHTRDPNGTGEPESVP